MSNRGKGQVQKSAEQRVSKIEHEMGVQRESINIILHDFSGDRPRYPGGCYAEDSPHISVTPDGMIIKLWIFDDEHPYPGDLKID